RRPRALRAERGGQRVAVHPRRPAALPVPGGDRLQHGGVGDAGGLALEHQVHARRPDRQAARRVGGQVAGLAGAGTAGEVQVAVVPQRPDARRVGTPVGTHGAQEHRRLRPGQRRDQRVPRGVPGQLAAAVDVEIAGLDGLAVGHRRLLPDEGCRYMDGPAPANSSAPPPPGRRHPGAATRPGRGRDAKCGQDVAASARILGACPRPNGCCGCCRCCRPAASGAARSCANGSASAPAPSAATSGGCATSATPCTPGPARAAGTGWRPGRRCRRCCSTTRRPSRSPWACAPPPGRAPGERSKGSGRRRCGPWPSSNRSCPPGCGAASAPCTPPRPPERPARRAAAPRRAPARRRAPRNGPPAGPRAAPRTLTVLAAACRDREVLRFTYRGGDGRETRRAAEPHGLVPAARRWYLVAYDTGGRAGPGSGSRGGTVDGGGGWRSFRGDRLTCPRPTGVRFAPREVPGGDPAAFVARSRAGPEPVSAVLTVHASAGELADRFRVGDAEIEPVDGRTCVLRTTPDSLEWTALRIAYLDLDFEDEGPPELTARLTAMAGRLSRAARRRDGGA